MANVHGGFLRRVNDLTYRNLRAHFLDAPPPTRVLNADVAQPICGD
jgi:hypothetical protein